MAEKSNKTQQLKLSATQRRLFDVLIDPRNLIRPITERCELAKIDRTTYYRHIKDEKFLKLIEDEADSMIKPHLALLMNSALKYAIQGDFRYWKALMLMAGKLTDKFGININIGKLVEGDREKYK